MKQALVAFYNVENLFDTTNSPHAKDGEFTPEGDKRWTAHRFDQKIENITEALLSISDEEYPAIIGLCEIENHHVLEELCASLSETSKHCAYRYIHLDDDDPRGIENALIYDQNEVEILDYRLEPIENHPQIRCILHVSCLYAHQRLELFINHWPSRRKGQAKSEVKRIASAKTLKTAVDQIRSNQPQASVLVMGDFNDFPVSASLSQHLKAKSDLQECPVQDLHNLAHEFHYSGEGTHKKRGNWLMFDQFICGQELLNGNNGLELVNQKMYIHNPNWMLYKDPYHGDYNPKKTYGGDRYYGGYSDHLPIYCFLKSTR